MMLKARRALRYAGKSVLKGGVFDAKPADARILVAAAIAEDYVAPPVVFRKPVVDEVSAFEMEADGPTVVKRGYKRRDMRAE